VPRESRREGSSENAPRRRSHFAAAAVAATQRSLDLATTRYREGASSYLDVVLSQTGSLLTRREAEDLATRQLRASVPLIRALGGGWTSALER
jgi:outer membrane protein TolC